MSATSSRPPVRDGDVGAPADALSHALADGARAGRPVGLVVLGLLGLDAIRGIHGRSAASAAVSQLRARLAGAWPGRDLVVVVLEGDRVAMVCPGCDELLARTTAEQAVDAIGSPLEFDPPAHVAASAGVAVAEKADLGPQELLRDAEAALAVATAGGPGAVEVFRPAQRESLAARTATAVDLAEALAGGRGLFLTYQPVLDLATGAIVGAEALVRWRHPRRGTVSPAEFIPVAEETGLIGDLGRWVLDAAVAQLAEWEPVVADGFRLHVNVSPWEIRQPRLVPEVADVLDRHDVPAARLLLEITETGLMTADDAAVPRLEELREVGVALGIDDFGTGYSSISYLRELPVDLVKVDRSLTSLVASSPEEYALTRAIFGLLRSSGLEVVAEGIEEHVQVAHLRAMRCRYGQGYLLARPGAPDAVGDLLGRRESSA